jgi:hypothetical protein
MGNEPEHTGSVDCGMFCLTVAAHGAIVDWSDLKVRGYLKEHPALTAYRLDALELMIARVREALSAEEIRWRRDQVANGWTPPDPDAEHHQQVAEFAAHAGCCPYCLICGGHREPDDEDVLDAWPDNDSSGV